MSAARLAMLLEERRPCVVLTGAGMSTESGIPDFRSASGLWAEVDPFEVASIEAFRRDPLRVWRWYGPRIHGLLAAEPNPGHRALAALERAGLVRAVVTQNIDTLHARAGSEDVVEVHGSIRRFVCLACGAEETLEGVLAQLEEREAPECPGCGTVLKPGVVMFGELLPVAEIERAERLAREAPLLLVVGSSLQVWPVAGLPEETLREGGQVAILNREPTPYDDRAALRLDGPAGETLAAVERLLLGG
ncbi:MAG TPA: NAD-dependent deacylase [Gaiellaceae bacterium]|nr:NAD-dependent deacylase [Gaiellaceae bacterium]